LKDDQVLRARLSERARRDFDTKYAWSRRAEKIVRLLTAKPMGVAPIATS
jgi:hypothetical protein